MTASDGSTLSNKKYNIPLCTASITALLLFPTQRCPPNYGSGRGLLWSFVVDLSESDIWGVLKEKFCPGMLARFLILCAKLQGYSHLRAPWASRAEYPGCFTTQISSMKYSSHRYLHYHVHYSSLKAVSLSFSSGFNHKNPCTCISHRLQSTRVQAYFSVTQSANK